MAVTDSTQPSARAVYVISVVAEMTGLHPQTLRVYERRGLLSPRRTPGGSRRFSDADLARLDRIRQLVAEGLSLVAVRRVMDLEDQIAQLHAQLTDAHRAALDAITQVHRRYRRDLVPLQPPGTSSDPI
jgi:MerR family transcriptional regulator/heat shock protein HspR